MGLLNIITTMIFFVLGSFSVTSILAQTAGGNSSSNKFSEGIIYSRTTFPGHKLNDSIKSLDFETGDFVRQYDVIQALKKYQQTISQDNEQAIKDAFFISGMMVLPLYTKMYVSPAMTLVSTDALGYHQEIVFQDNSGKLILSDRNKTNQGTVNFQKEDIKEVWQKYQIDAAQYSMQTTAETTIIAGYKCKKVIYTFGGTSRGSGVSHYIINLLPLKVTAWYNDELPTSVNLIHPLQFEEAKAILKFEVEYDNNHKNRMMVEIMKIEPRNLEEEVFTIKNKAPVIQHKAGEYESGMMIMQVMMNAISQLTK